MKPAITPIHRPLRLTLLGATCWAALATLAALRAQSTSGAAAPDNSAPAAPASAPATAVRAPESEVITLNPFEVQEDPSNSYSTLNSNSITRFNVELNKMPLSADIFDQAFMNDVGATSIESMIQSYSAGAGFSGNDPGSTAAASTGDHTGHANMELRGFTVPYMMRDSLMPVGSFFNPGSTGSSYTSNFDLERAEVIEGPQSLLYSSGGGGGVINVVSKQARLDQPSFGTLTYRGDQFGSKMGQLDYGMGTANFAIRFAMIDYNQDSRRVNLSSSLEGYYLQVAAKAGNTTVRFTGEQTTFNQLLGESDSLTAASTSADSRNGQALSYLLASNQIGANTLNAAGQPNGSGAIDNGNLNWGNVNSFGGWDNENLTVNTFLFGEADTTWNSWLSTQVSAGYNDFYFDLDTNGESFYAPTSSSNPYTGNWTAGISPSDLAEPGRAKAVRFVALATNDFFGGRAKSQTIAGGDFLRQDAGQFSISYFQADSNFNPIVTPSLTTYDSRTIIPKQYWTINNGPIEYSLYAPRAPRISVGGVNYVRMLENYSYPQLVTPADPMGTITGTSGTYEVAKAFNQGWFAVNNTQWFDGKLDTLLGVRLAHFFTQTQTGSTPDSARPQTHNTDFDVGADYALTGWLRAYASASNTYYPPEEKGNNPIGQPTSTSSATAEEVGLKFNTSDNRFSGSLSFYHDAGKNEQYETSTTVEDDINPAGINGQFGTSPSQWVYVSRTAEGLNLVLTANPTPNWRLRFNAADVGGTVGTTTAYAQLYNDQFNENSAGDVTYADGTIVYVPPTFNSKTPTTTSSTAGAVPLTVALLNNPSSVYYANPVNPSGQISTSSAVYTVLKSVDPVHGSIGTGKVGLPISDLQITPPFALPGTITVTEKGDHTFGYPQLTFNLTSIYEFSEGGLKGFEAGGTLAGECEYSEYYYYPLGVANSLQRSVFTLPAGMRFDLILGYTRRLRHVTWSTQMNVYNLTNHYSIVILPNESTGWSSLTSLTARFSQDPRSYTWSSSIRF